MHRRTRRGRQRKRERVKDEIRRFQAIPVGGDIEQPVGNPHLPLNVTRLTVLIDQQTDHRSAVFLGER